MHRFGKRDKLRDSQLQRCGTALLQLCAHHSHGDIGSHVCCGDSLVAAGFPFLDGLIRVPPGQRGSGRIQAEKDNLPKTTKAKEDAQGRSEGQPRPLVPFTRWWRNYIIVYALYSGWCYLHGAGAGHPTEVPVQRQELSRRSFSTLTSRCGG